MIALALSAMLLAAPSDACSDDRGRDICDPAVQARMREGLQAEPAEALARRGVEGVRVFMVNGYGADRPMVAVLWKGAAAPTIEARIDRGEAKPSVLEFAGSPWTKETALTLIRLERKAKPQPPGFSKTPTADGGEEIVLCMHAWVALIETMADGKVRRAVRDTCGEDAVFDGAFQLATQAINASEACRAVPTDGYRNDWDRLVSCPAIQGPNVNGAASVFELGGGDRFSLEEGKGGDFLDLLASDVSWQGPDGAAAGPPAVSAAWSRFAGASDQTAHWVRTATATGSQASVDGIAVRWTGDTACYAPSRQEWSLIGDRWLLKSWSVGDCVAQPRPSDPE